MSLTHLLDVQVGQVIFASFASFAIKVAITSNDMSHHETLKARHAEEFLSLN